MDFSSLEIYNFSGYRFYYGLGDRAYVLVEIPTGIIDLNSFNIYNKDKIHALMRLSDSQVIQIHDNLEVRIDKIWVDQIVTKYPDYEVALRAELEKLSIFASNLRFYIQDLVNKIDEILEDYSGTRYHETNMDKRHFVSRIISNFDRYVRLDELKLNWVNFIDLLSQVRSKHSIVVFNTWRSFFVVQNYVGSGFSKFYYKFSRELLSTFIDHPEIELIHLSEKNIDEILNPSMIRVQDSTITTTNPIRYIDYNG